MDGDFSQQIEQRLSELPEDVRNAVMSVEWEQKVQAIAARHKLHIDQSGALGDLTLMAMLGFTDLGEYPARIAQELKLPPDEAALVAKEVSDEVFMTIRESMKKFIATREKTAIPAPAVSKPDLSSADTMLSQKTVSTPPLAPVAPAPAPATPAAPAPAAKPDPVKPQNYATDPYREPPV